MVSKKIKRSLWDMKIVRRAAVDSLVKLHPVTMMRNPVMFVVEVGSVVQLNHYRTAEKLGIRIRVRLQAYRKATLSIAPSGAAN